MAFYNTDLHAVVTLTRVYIILQGEIKPGPSPCNADVYVGRREHVTNSLLAIMPGGTPSFSIHAFRSRIYEP